MLHAFLALSCTATQTQRTHASCIAQGDDDDDDSRDDPYTFSSTRSEEFFASTPTYYDYIAECSRRRDAFYEGLATENTLSTGTELSESSGGGSRAAAAAGSDAAGGKLVDAAEDEAAKDAIQELAGEEELSPEARTAEKVAMAAAATATVTAAARQDSSKEYLESTLAPQEDEFDPDEDTRL